ncbi:ComEC/Rec2 family competence protein [Neorhizobium alkalisoli]|uniref:ComEC/Rec2-related protein n=1 Tax=Neorhizobium alkalisoli TaxID=528178 RepID=A0A561QHH5_9HYPH|nr:ComEC/Rec2 family competence protein [Neorhizobium alkalisoli]TWF49835.1 ComEC/Rec2-related protein [Neorhizobium alkalisoli]
MSTEPTFSVTEKAEAAAFARGARIGLAGARDSLVDAVERADAETTEPAIVRPRFGTGSRSPQSNRRNKGWLGRRLRPDVRRLPATLRLLAGEEKAYGHVFLFVPVLVGTGAITWFSLPRDPPFWTLVFFLVVTSVATCLTRHRHGAAGYIWSAALLFSIGMILGQLETWRHATVILDSPVTTEVTGIIDRREVDAEGRWRYLLRVEQTAAPRLARAPERVSLLVRGRQVAFLAGDRISGKARLSPPSGPALPGLNDFAFSAYFDGIGAIGFFYGTPRLEASGAATTDWPEAIENWLFSLRSEIGTRIRETVPGDAGAFAAAIVTDERRAISKETTEALRLSGLAHIVAISGLNMALAAGIFFIGLRTLLALFPGFGQAFPVKKLAAFGALLMVTAYYLISGFGVSAERAYVMMTVILIAVLFDRASISLRNVAISALIILVLSPSEILGPSFQMSFAATAALVAGYAAWKRKPDRENADPRGLRHLVWRPLVVSASFIAGITATSMIGSTSTAIYSVEHFHRLATYGLAANLAAMPLISFVVMPAALVGMLLMPFGLDWPFLAAMGWGLDLVITIAKHVASWGGDVAIGRQHAWFLALASAGFVLLTLLRTRLRLVGLPLLALALLLSWSERSKPLADLLVSEDGTLVALIEAGSVATNRSRPPSFIYDQWKRALVLDEQAASVLVQSPAVFQKKPRAGDMSTDGRRKRPDLTPAEIENAGEAIATAPEGRFDCMRGLWCVTRSAEGMVIAVIEDGRYAGAACDVAGLVIAPTARFENCRSGATILNGATLRRTGALEVFLNGSARPENWKFHAAMAEDGKGGMRAWNAHRYYDWRRKAFNPDLPEEIRARLH